MTPLRLSIEVALLATVIVVAIGLPASFVLLRLPRAGARVLEALMLVPLVVPPSVTGLALLWLLGAQGPIGRASQSLVGRTPLFTLTAAVVASSVIAFPLFVRSARAALEAVPTRPLQLARALGDGPWRVAVRLHLPLARRGLLAGVALAFGRAMGEFGATLMVAGNIPGKTETLALAVYDLALAGEDQLAWRAAALLAAVGLAVLVAVAALEGKP